MGRTGHRTAGPRLSLSIDDDGEVGALAAASVRVHVDFKLRIGSEILRTRPGVCNDGSVIAAHKIRNCIDAPETVVHFETKIDVELRIRDLNQPQI